MTLTDWIEPDPYSDHPGDARLKGYGVPIWSLVAYVRAFEGDYKRVARDFEVPEEAVRAALDYLWQQTGIEHARLTLLRNGQD